jgi:biotin carboxyl carrier protein
MKILPVEKNIFSVLIEGEQYQVFLETLDGDCFATINGRRYHVPYTDPRAFTGQGSLRNGAGAARIIAPMPGKVVRILVEQGAHVEAGDGLAVVEAMKMQNELKSPVAGLVTQIKVEAGATVRANEILMLVEAPIPVDGSVQE